MKWFYNLLCTIWQKAASINDRLFREGADFSEWMSTQEAGFSETQGNKYQPCTDALKEVLKKFPVVEEDSILDIGCGKGKAMYLMSRFPFGKIRGYDLSKQLVKIANQNFKKLGLTQCEAFQADAAEYTAYDEFNYFYLFNSLPEEVFKAAMARIIQSIRRNPRTCRLIYLNPVCHEYLISNTPFRLVYKKTAVIPWNAYYCYECTAESQKF